MLDPHLLLFLEELLDKTTFLALCRSLTTTSLTQSSPGIARSSPASAAAGSPAEMLPPLPLSVVGVLEVARLSLDDSACGYDDDDDDNDDNDDDDDDDDDDNNNEDNVD
jgi:hypothetical protein